MVVIQFIADIVLFAAFQVVGHLVGFFYYLYTGYRDVFADISDIIVGHRRLSLRDSVEGQEEDLWPMGDGYDEDEHEDAQVEALIDA